MSTTGRLNHSRQRDSILNFLSNTKEHPTADIIYNGLRKEFPNISLGTVYRNLSLLCDTGEIIKISVPGQPERYDFTTDNHYHFICTKCGRVLDLPVNYLGFLNEAASEGFDGTISGHICQFYGYCADCKYT